MKDNNLKIEERGFLFIDLRDSMLLVERLGLVSYSKFISYCFNLLEKTQKNYPTLELHQYAGDGVIFTWQDLENTQNAVDFFKHYINTLEDHKTTLSQWSEVFPFFSSAISIGKTVTGEQANFRVFYGNAINSTARLQNLTKHYEQQLLISEDAYQYCTTKDLDYINRVYLKGLPEAMTIYGWAPSV